VLELTDHEPFADHLELHLVELPKLAEPSSGLDEEADLARWGRFLAAESDQEREELARISVRELRALFETLMRERRWPE
jgi:hypothetical protein